MSKPGRLRVRATILAAALSLTLVVVAPSTALAYDGNVAATYARDHALACIAGVPCLANDCTNYVSYSLKAGGYDVDIGNGVNEDLRNWFSTKNGLGGWEQSFTWAYARHLYEYLIAHDEPGGGLYGWANGTSSYSYTGLTKGRLVFYDWTNNGSIDHVSMLTAVGKDLKWHATQIGDLVSTHTTNRLNVWWTLNPYNSNRNFTRIRLVSIDAAN